MNAEYYNNRPKRKQNRLTEYMYNETGAYFITICVKERKRILWKCSSSNAGEYQLSEYGCVVEDAIKRIPEIYPEITVDNYVIMPDHVHLLLQIHEKKSGRAMRAPTVSTVVCQFKGCVTKIIGQSIWQKSFYDHVIRSEHDYNQIWTYIDENPLNS